MNSLFLNSHRIRTSIPPELINEAALLSYLDLSEQELKKIWWFRNRMYHSFEITKKNGKVRVINAPDDRLKYLQRKISLLLNKLYRARHPVHGFVPDKSVKTNALAHLRKQFVINIDLKDFFPTITENRVEGMLKALGIDNNVSSIVARICCYNNHLPQGAPTSPILSNMICFRLDKELLSFSKKMGCIYTRYADDLTLSCHQPMTMLFDGSLPPAGHFSPDILVPELQNILSNNGFNINQDKAYYADKNSRKTVTGIKINEILNVDRRYVRNIRATLHSVEKLGKKEAQKKFEAQHGGKSDIGHYLQGKITWLRHIRGHSDPVFRAIAIKFNNCFPTLEIDITPTETEVLERAVWVIEHYEGDMAQGTAFFLKDVGLVTAAHCVKEATEIEIHHPSKPSNKFTALVSKIDIDRDLAILSHKIPPTEYFELNRSPLNKISVGKELIAVGYPSYNLGDKPNIRTGTVSSEPKKMHAVLLIEVTQKLAQGMSGGPLIDSNFAVIGIIHKGGPTEGRDFAVHINELDNLIK